MHDHAESEPSLALSRDGVDFLLLGTAHISKASVIAVEEAIRDGHYDLIAVELCARRLDGLKRKNALAELDLFEVMRRGQTGPVLASLMLSAYQARMGEALGVDPGAEMRAAVDGAAARGTALTTIDRDIGVTLRRTYAALGFSAPFKLCYAIVDGMMPTSDAPSAADVEALKRRDLLEASFGDFARGSPKLYNALIAERDRYMAARLVAEARGHGARKVLAVIGAGHLAGTSEALADPTLDPVAVVNELDRPPPPSRLWPLLGWLAAFLLVAGLVVGFLRGPELGLELVLTWILITGGCAGVGALLAGAHPIAAIGGMVSAPITILHPLIAAGMISGALEAWLRKPKVADLERLRLDVTRISGWWRNGAARIFTVFLLTNIGAGIGSWIAGLRIVSELFKGGG